MLINVTLLQSVAVRLWLYTGNVGFIGWFCSSLAWSQRCKTPADQQCFHYYSRSTIKPLTWELLRCWLLH